MQVNVELMLGCHYLAIDKNFDYLLLKVKQDHVELWKSNKHVAGFNIGATDSILIPSLICVVGEVLQTGTHEPTEQWCLGIRESSYIIAQNNTLLGVYLSATAPQYCTHISEVGNITKFLDVEIWNELIVYEREQVIRVWKN